MLGDLEVLQSPEGTLAYHRTLGDDACNLINFTGEEVDVSALGLVGTPVLLDSDDPAPTHGWSGTLGPDRAVVLAG